MHEFIERIAIFLLRAKALNDIISLLFRKRQAMPAGQTALASSHSAVGGMMQ